MLFNELILGKNLFLILLAFIWIVGAIFQDFKRREVDNIWNFSLIAFALSYRMFFSIFSGEYWFILNGLIGLGIFFLIENLLYYSKVFAGGDAKLLFSLGAILPLSYSWMINFKLFGLFLLFFLVSGSIYALIYSFFLVFLNFNRFKKEFYREFKEHKGLYVFSLVFFFLWVFFGLFSENFSFILIGIIILLFPLLFVFAKSVEEGCMIKKLSPQEVTEGDWLYEDIIVSGKKIMADWNGVSKRELAWIRAKCRKKIFIKQGIPFTPSFLFGFILLLFFIWSFSKWL